MINYFIALLVAVYAVGCGNVGELDVGYNIAIVCGEGEDATYCGTAFAVEKNIWITAYHVVDDRNKIKIFFDNKWELVTVGNTLPNRDIAILFSDYIQAPEPLDLCGTPNLGEHVCGCGVNVSGILYCDCGTVLAKNSKKVDWIDGAAMRVGISANHGWSGAPVLDHDSCVVGVIIAGNDSWKYSYAVPVPGGER